MYNMKSITYSKNVKITYLSFPSIEHSINFILSVEYAFLQLAELVKFKPTCFLCVSLFLFSFPELS